MDNPGVNDAELLAEAKAGDASALEALLRRFQPRVLRFGLRLCRNSADAEDIVQETLLAAARTLGRFRGDASPSTWLYTIARSFCIKKRRRSRHAPEEVSIESERGRAREVRDPGRGPDRLADDRRLRAALEGAIAALDTGYREVLLLRDVEGLPAADVARATGLSVAAVKSRLHRARAEVRARLAPILGGVKKHSSSCPDIVRLLSRHLEGDVAPATCARMERHLDDCPQCRQACHSLRRVLRLCQATPLPRVSPRLKASIRRGVKRLSTAR